MRVLVTGGAGFIGRATVRELVHRGHDVVVLDALEPQVHGTDPVLPGELGDLVGSGSLEFVHGRVEDAPLLRRLLADAHGVIHLAALVGVGQSTYEARRYTMQNTLAVSTLFEEIVSGKTTVERIVSASSISNYGEGAGWNPRRQRRVAPVRRRSDLLRKQWEPIDETDGLPVAPIKTAEDYAQRPSSIYGLTKQYTEECTRLLGESTGLSAVSLRYGVAYGPGQALSNPYTGVMCIFYARLSAGKPPILFEDGLQRRSYTHVSDIARANAMALEKDFADPTCLNISSSEETSLVELCRTIAAGMGTAVDPRALNVARVGDVRHLLPDTERATAALGFEARLSLADGIAHWLKSIASAQPRDRTRQALQELAKHGMLLGDLPADLRA